MITYKDYSLTEKELQPYRNAFAAQKIKSYIKKYGHEPDLETAASFYVLSEETLNKIKIGSYASYYVHNDGINSPDIIPPVSEHQCIVHTNLGSILFHCDYKDGMVKIWTDDLPIQAWQIELPASQTLDTGYGNTKEYFLNTALTKLEIHHIVNGSFTGKVTFTYGSNWTIDKYFFISEEHANTLEIHNMMLGSMFRLWWGCSFVWYNASTFHLYDSNGVLLVYHPKGGSVFLEDKPWEYTYSLDEFRAIIITAVPNESFKEHPRLQHGGFLVDLVDIVGDGEPITPIGDYFASVSGEVKVIEIDNLWDSSFSFNRETTTITINENGAYFHVEGNGYDGKHHTYEFSIMDEDETIETGTTIDTGVTPDDTDSAKYVPANYDWMELPSMDNDELIYRCHFYMLGNNEQHNYSYGFSPKDRISMWVAYPLNRTLIGSGIRQNSWGYDPLLPSEIQQNILSGYYKTSDNSTYYDRGHMLPSADRLSSEANNQIWYFTNFTPQSNLINTGVWAEIETKVRANSYSYDMSYVVTGVICGEDSRTALDNDGNEVTVPTHFYKAVLSYKKGTRDVYDTYCVVVNHDTAQIQEMTLNELESITGMCFYPNLKDMVGEQRYQSIKAQQPILKI